MVAVTLTATFTTAGPFTWTCPAGVTSVIVACQGGGGSGGDSGIASGGQGGGGGGGEAACEPALAVTPGVAYSGTVGAGGPGAGAGLQPGGDSSFTGDSTVVYAHGGGGGGTGNALGAGQAGAGGDGSVNFSSAAGGAGDAGTPSANGGGGGGAGGADTIQGYPGNPGSGSAAGAATAGAFPGGAGGAGSTSGAGPGADGSVPGGGGGGALSTGTGRNGGSGGGGQVTITWTQNDPVTLAANTDGGTYKFTAPSGATLVTAEAWGAGAGGFSTTPVTGSGGLAGATVWQVYGSTAQTNRVSVADIFDGYVGVPLARQAQKIFFNEAGGDSIASYNDINHPQQIGNLNAAGCFVLLCVKPNRNFTVTDDFTALQSALAAIRTAIGAANFAVIPWMECNLNDNTGVGGPWFPSAAAYLAYWNHYVPAVPSDVKVYLNVGMAQEAKAVQFVQVITGSAARPPDAVGADWYDSSMHNGVFLTYGTGDPKYPGVFDACDTAGVPPGVFEYGGSASGSFFPTTAQWHDYIYGASGLLTVIQARKAAGSPVSHVLYYGGGGPGLNDIESAADFRIPALKDINTAMASGLAVGGAGGGGGEYAKEASLAITDSHQYVLAVGSGAPKASGGNSTIAGDSVTVIGHGGSVAAATGTGGAGGTGSANTTHHGGGAGGAGGIAGGGAGGGGGSGGTALAGNAGSAGTAGSKGAGAAAVTGGGPGGDGGGPAGGGHAPATSPGGGGGGRGATGLVNGAGADGQVTLSSFVTHPAGPVSFGLAPVAFAGTGSVGISSFALAPLHLAGTVAVSMVKYVQNGPVSTGPFTLPAPSAAGNAIIASVVQTTQSQSVPPAGQGWNLLAAENTGGAGGRAELWMLPGANNPGGITSVAWTGGTAFRGFLTELSCPAGYAIIADAAPGVANGTTGAITFPVSCGAALGADLLFALFEDQFSVNPTSTWTTPSGGWVNISGLNSAVPDIFRAYYLQGSNAGGQSVTGQFNTSANQVGWAAILASFTAVPLNASAGSFTLAPLALSATGTAVVPPTIVQTSGGLALAPLAFQSPDRTITFPARPLPVRVEILINGAWADITSYVRASSGITISGRGRPNEASTATATQATMTLDNRDGSFSPANPGGQFYPYLVRNTQIRISVVNATTPQGAWYNGYRFWGEIPAFPVLWDPSGTDVYITITAAGVLQRMAQSKTLGSPLRRYYHRVTQQQPALAPAAYWPCEDGTSATSFASALNGGSPMTWTGGTPGLAADSDAAGSGPFAQLNGTTWAGTPGAFSSGGLTFTTPGTFTWTCPAGITSIKAECWGAGGGGANGGGPAGGGGEYAAEAALAVTPGKTYTLVIGAGGAGAAGAFSKQTGSAGASTSFSGDSVTITAHGGKGGPKTGSGGAGGTGYSRGTHNNGGRGGSDGGGFGGPSGGGSGGPGAAGNAGSQSNGTIAAGTTAAVPGGGPGGAGGTGATAASGNKATPGFMPVPGPGGGGGAGGFGSSNNYYKPGGGGAPGQIGISFGAAVPAPPAVVLRGVIDVPSGGGVDGSYMLQALTSGTVADLHVKYHTGGNLELRGNNSGGGQLFSTGSKSFGANGQPLLVSAELTQKTASTIGWKLTAIKPGATSVVATWTGTITGTLGSVTSVKSNSTAPLDTGATGIGHITVQYAVDPILNLAGAFGAYAGELAATRFVRLCGEQNIPVTLAGNAADTPQMGPQPNDLLINLLQDCENTDLGQMYETRNTFGLGYVTRVAMQNQSAACTLDYSLAQLAQGLAPTDDDQLTRNDITATRANGSSYEAELTTGPMSTQDPPNGVGLYSYPVTVNVFTDAQLPGFAQWLLILGTVDEFRYPVITVDLARTAVSDGTFYAVAALDIASFVQIINTPSWLPPGPVSQLCFGFTETLNAFEWTIAINAVPADPYSSAPGSPLPTW